MIAAYREKEVQLGLLDLERLRESPLNHDPFDFVVVENFVRPEHLPTVIADFPMVRQHGSFPLGVLPLGETFERFAGELEATPLREAIEHKFALDLAARPTMITVRGQSDGKDGRIHTDSATKLVTLLIYLNPEWQEEGGRLRLLRAADDLEACAAEVAPLAGTMVAFRRSATSYHGHYPHRGERRVLQLNWVTEPAVVRRELARHRWSSRLKALNPFG